MANKNPERPKDMDKIMSEVFNLGASKGRIDEKIRLLDKKIEELNLKIALLNLRKLKNGK